MPPACSGDMYAGVPITEPAAVWKPMSSSSRLSSLATPKSSSLTSSAPSAVGITITLSGLRSRWTTPTAWAAARPSQICTSTASARGRSHAGACPLAQAHAAEELHDDERRAVVELDEVGDVDDVAVADPVDGARLLEEPEHRVAAPRVVAAQELERDLAAELDVLGAVHVAHAALAEQLEDLVAAEHRSDPIVGILGVLRDRGRAGWRARRIPASGRARSATRCACAPRPSRRPRSRARATDERVRSRPPDRSDSDCVGSRAAP